MLAHITPNCKSEVHVDVSGAIKVLMEPIISPRGISGRITITQGKIIPREISFYCLRCKNALRLEDISFICSACGENFPIVDGKVPVNSGGVYCPEHIRRFTKDNEPIANLETILKSGNINF